jgi:NADH-quinone oxidoreductase subunit K
VTAAVWSITGLLFAAGLTMTVLRRQLLAMLLGVELMLAAVNVALVHSAALFSDAQAMAAVVVVIAVSAAEAVVGLSLVLRVLRAGRGVDAGGIAGLRG